MATEGSTNQREDESFSNGITVPVRPETRRDWLIEALLHIGRCLSDEDACANFEKNWPVIPEGVSDEVKNNFERCQRKVIKLWKPYWQWLIGQEFQRIVNGITQLHKLLKSDGTKGLSGIDDENVPPSHRRYVQMLKDLWDELDNTQSINRERSHIPKKTVDLQLGYELDIDRLQIDIKYQSGKGTKREYKRFMTLMKHLIKVLEEKSAVCPEPWPNTESEQFESTIEKHLMDVVQKNWGLTWKCIADDAYGRQLNILLELLKLVPISHLRHHMRAMDDKSNRDLKKNAVKMMEINLEVLKKFIIDVFKGKKTVPSLEPLKKQEEDDVDVTFRFHEIMISRITEIFTQNSFDQTSLPYPPDDAEEPTKTELLRERERMQKLLLHHWTKHHQDACSGQQGKPLQSCNENKERTIEKGEANKIYVIYLENLVHILENEHVSFIEFPSFKLAFQTDKTFCDNCEGFKWAMKDHWEQHHSPVRSSGGKRGIESELQFFRDLFAATIKVVDEGGEQLSNPEIPETLPQDKRSELYGVFDKMQHLLYSNRTKVKEVEEKLQISADEFETSKTRYKNTLRRIKTESQFYKGLCEITIEGCHDDDYRISMPQIPETFPQEKGSQLVGTFQKMEDSLRATRTKVKDLEEELRKSEASQDKTEMKDRIHDLRLKLKKSDDECGTLRTRLSEMAGAKLTRGNSAITDLSDPNRPTKISEKFSELYDNEWTNALEELGNPEKKAIYDLLSGLRECFYFCIDEQKKMWSKLGKTYTGKTSDFETLAEEQEWTDVELKKLHEAHKIWMKAAFGKTVKKFMKGVDASKSAEGYRTYMQKCLDLCWLMRMQDPPMCIDFDFKKGKPFDKNILRFFTKTGEKIDYLVWPVLRIHDKGDPLGKGVAQPL